MDLDDVLLRDSFFGKKLQDVLPLVTLELDDHSVFGIVDNGAVAVELLLERLEDCMYTHTHTHTHTQRERERERERE